MSILITLTFPPGCDDGFADRLGNCVYPDAHGQVTLDAAEIILTEYLEAGFVKAVRWTASERPLNVSAGVSFFDATLGTAGRPIWRNASNSGWIDAAGLAV